MRYDIEIKSTAIELRLQGHTYAEISQRLNIPQSTLSGWLKHIPLSQARKQELYASRIKRIAESPNGSRERRSREIAHIRESSMSEIAKELPDETLKLFGAALYWAEGTKKGNLEITNSDPYLILFMVKWIELAFGVYSRELKARLNIYEQQDDMELKFFWSELCDIPIERFGKSYLKTASSGYKKNNLYYGTIKITVPKSSDMIHKVFGWTRAVLENSEINPTPVLSAWDSLRKVERLNTLNYIELTRP